MQDEDLKLIRQIVASDGRKYTAGNIDRSRYDRLVDLGWLTPFKTNISDSRGEKWLELRLRFTILRSRGFLIWPWQSLQTAKYLRSLTKRRQRRRCTTSSTLLVSPRVQTNAPRTERRKAPRRRDRGRRHDRPDCDRRG